MLTIPLINSSVWSLVSSSAHFFFLVIFYLFIHVLSHSQSISLSVCLSICLCVIYPLVNTYIFWDRQELWHLCFVILRYWNILINLVGIAVCLRKHTTRGKQSQDPEHNCIITKQATTSPSWFARKLKYRSGNGGCSHFSGLSYWGSGLATL